MTSHHPALNMPAPKGYRCPVCRHSINAHREHGCDVPNGDGTCECGAPYGRIMPGDPPPMLHTTDSLGEHMTMGELLRLITEYGAATTSFGYRLGVHDGSGADEANKEAMAHYEKIIAEVRRLYQELGADDGSYVGETGPDG